MKNNPFEEDRDVLAELLKNYDNLKNGRSHSFIEEDAFEKIISYFEEKEDNKAAMEAVELATERYPYSSGLLIRKADILLNNRRYNEALEVLEFTSLLDKNDINLYILKTDALLALDRQEEAVQLLEEALHLFTGEERIEMLFELADVYDDYEDFDKVFDCLKMILAQEPTNEEALYKICFWTDFTGRNEEGIRLHKEIIDEYPYNELAWFNLAAAYQGLKLYEKAIDAYKYALVIEEKFDYAYRNMGDAYIRLRKYKDAIEALEKVLELSKPEDVIYEAIGHCYDKLKNYAQARFYYRKATHLNQEDSKLFYKIACTYVNEGQFQNAIKQLETALRLNRNQSEYHLLLGECKQELGLVKDAIQYITAAVRLRPKSVANWEALVKCLYSNEYYDQALEQAEIAYDTTGNKVLFVFYQALIHFSQGKVKESLLLMETALQSSPKLLKKILSLEPAILQNSNMLDLIAKYKRKK